MALHRNFWDTQPFQGELGADEPRKKKNLLSVKYWLFNRHPGIPYNGKL